MMNDRYGRYIDINIMGITQRMRWIEPGHFLMGSPDEEPGRYGENSGIWNEGPQHEVRLSKGYWLFDTPVTQELWIAVMGDNPSYFKHPKQPVETVSWYDAMRFIEKINTDIPGLDLVLPTEAQWEYACRAGTTTPNYAGGEKDLEDIAWFNKNSDYKTRPVATKKCNAWGLHDMLGNVWEWCADDLRKYESEPITDPFGSLNAHDAEPALRGGSWCDYAHDVRSANRDWCDYAHDVRSANRDAGDRDIQGIDIGFRCARISDF